MNHIIGRQAVIGWLLALQLLACRAVETSSEAERSTEPAAPSAAEEQEAPPAMRGALLAFRSAREAEETGDLEAALTHSMRALEGMPSHPLILHQLASLRARLGQNDGALELLERIATVGGRIDLPADDSAWDGLRDDARFQTLAEDLRPAARGRTTG